jgi:hypothetical protein
LPFGQSVKATQTLLFGALIVVALYVPVGQVVQVRLAVSEPTLLMNVPSAQVASAVQTVALVLEEKFVPRVHAVHVRSF